MKNPFSWQLGSAWMVVAAFFFTLMGVLVKKTANDFDFGFYELVFWRTIFAVVVLGVLALARGDHFSTPHWQAHIWRGVAGSLGVLLFFYSIANLSLATATTLSYTSAIFLALLSWLFLKEKIAPMTLLVLLAGFVGVVLLLGPSFSAGQSLSALIGLCAGLSAAWAYLQVRYLAQLGEPNWRVVFYFSAVAALMSAALSTLNGWQPLTAQNLLYVLGIGLTATLAQLALTQAYRVGRKFVVAALSYLTVVFSALLGFIYLGDTLHWQEVLGMGIIIASGILSSVRKTSTVN
ncbi:DMT family transporter [Stenoxybacter acetivorans]|uniref:DMT family transporter n=1 Tax=Stenoxybacter acetivorans TaxID=422441 RepID=UPI00055EEA29|nr:DMT family transporter [Stenoxybacter acetivorans]